MHVAEEVKSRLVSRQVLKDGNGPSLSSPNDIGLQGLDCWRDVGAEDLDRADASQLLPDLILRRFARHRNTGFDGKPTADESETDSRNVEHAEVDISSRCREVLDELGRPVSVSVDYECIAARKRHAEARIRCRDFLIVLSPQVVRTIGGKVDPEPMSFRNPSGCSKRDELRNKPATTDTGDDPIVVAVVDPVEQVTEDNQVPSEGGNVGKGSGCIVDVSHEANRVACHHLHQPPASIVASVTGRVRGYEQCERRKEGP
ncbi:MAG TPA: hypothetical protein VLA29_10160 [Acidimicrobiia bacterium]|nr:hypothetical protein [Acidimicrobiia bacterium]